MRLDLDGIYLRSPGGERLLGLLGFKGGPMQLIHTIQAQAHYVPADRLRGDKTHVLDAGSVIIIDVQTDHLSPEQARAQLEGAADLVGQLVPLGAALSDGQVTPEEVVEVAAQLRALERISPAMRAVLIELVARLRMDLADGRITRMEAALSVLAVGRTAVGL